MNQKTITLFVAALLVVGGGSFYGGMKYAQSKAPANQGGQFGQNGGRFNGQGGQRGGRGGQNGGAFVNGDIIAKDDKSITVKGRDGGSKIVFFSGSTQVLESVAGKVEDLAVGKTVVVNGTPNSDGSITGQMVQIRLAEPNASSTPRGQ